MSPVVSGAVRPLVAVELQHEIEQFLYAEAALLDSWRLDEWLAIMAPDVHYWAPTRQNRLVREVDYEDWDEALAPPDGSAYFDDTHLMLEGRVERIHTGLAWAENPPSRIRHLICNVRISATEKPDEYGVESNFYVFRTRLEREMDRFVGTRDDILRRADNSYGWQVAKRTIILDMATLLAKNISVFF